MVLTLDYRTPFADIIFVKMAFLAVAMIKSKYPSKTNMKQEMRVAVSNLILRLHHKNNTNSSRLPFSWDTRPRNPAAMQ